MLLEVNQIYSQEKTSFKAIWDEVDQLKKEGRSRTALEKSEFLIEKAKKEGNSAEQIKGQINRMYFRSLIEEDAFITSINEMEMLINEGDMLTSALLHSVLAEMYWWYYTNNQWEILQRTLSDDSLPADIKVWDARQFVEKIDRHYEQSLENDDILKRTPAEKYDIIWVKDVDSRYLSPTLYNVLLNRALEFYTTNISGLTLARDQFNIDDSKYFDSAEKFVRFNIKQTDYNSFELRSLELFQKILKFHMADENINAMAWYDLRRLKFVYDKNKVSDRDSLYQKSLKVLHEKYKKSEISAEILYSLAQNFADLADRYHWKNYIVNRWHYKTALEYCALAVAAYPESIGANLCRNLNSSILSASYNIEIETVNSPERRIDFAVTYKNIRKLYFRIVDNSRSILIKEASKSKEQDIYYFLSKKPFRSWSVDLIDSSDYQTHGMEFSMEGLSSGYYSLISSTEPDFKTVDNILTFNNFWVSEMGYFFHQDNFSGPVIFVSDRITGQPLKGVKANFYKEEYNYNHRGRDLIDAGMSTSDENGKVSIPGTDVQRNYHVLLSKGKDSLMISNPIYVRESKAPEPRKILSTALFTDRSIYRPGQIIYFKGILMEKEGHAVQLIKGKTITVKLMDVNSREIGRVDISTNSYGTFQGSLIIPKSLLTGAFFIDDGLRRHHVFVEEYKRPGFLIEVDEIKENIRLGDVIKIKGKAKTFNDVSLSNAKGTFHIERYASMSIPYYGFSYLPIQKAEISQGSFLLDEKGNFEFEFIASADKSLPKENLPVFNFNAEIMISDLTGESQQEKITIPIGYHSLNIGLEIESEVNKMSIDSASLSTVNLSGVFTPANVEMEVLSLKAPATVIREMLWNTPDYSVQSSENEKELKKYTDEVLTENWDKGEIVFNKNISTSRNKKISLSEFKDLPSGAYVINLRAVDPYGQEVTWSKNITLFSELDKKAPLPISFWSKLLSTQKLVGENITVLLASVHKTARIYFTVSSKDGVYKDGWIDLKGNMSKIEVPVEEKDRGGIVIHLAMVSEGRVYLERHHIDVPLDNKKLNINLSTLRNNMRPGDTESWSFNITNNKGNTVRAEVLASMYDASLDKIRMHKWNFNPYHLTVPSVYWFTGSNFSSNSGRNYNFKEGKYISVKSRSFDQLNWFGLTYYGKSYMMRNMAFDDGDAMMNEKSKSNVQLSKSEENEIMVDQTEEERPSPPKSEFRSNFEETAFFYPELKTDTGGNVELTFKVPESLTKWKLQVLAHTETLEYGYQAQEMITQKELMVVSNYPRFLVSGDTILFTSKISNLTGETLETEVDITISNTLNNKTLQNLLESTTAKRISILPSQSIAVSWLLIAPAEPGIIDIAVFAKTPNHRDGERRSIPVLSKDILVNETYPISLRPGVSKSVDIKNLYEAYNSIGIRPKRLTIEFTSDPVWNVVQALPYLADIGNESTEQMFNRYYSNSLANYIAGSNEKIQRVFELWRDSDGEAFISNLEKNPELKQTVLTETPWLLEAKSETADNQKIAMFFDKNNINNSLSSALFDLLQSQSPNGGWPWFKGMEDNRYITQHITLGIARLGHLGIKSILQDESIKTALELSVTYLDKRMEEDYRQIIARVKNREDNHLSPIQIHYLFMRSYYIDIPLDPLHREAFEYFSNQCKKYWLSQNKYLQAMIALTFNRNGDKELPGRILLSLKENAINHDEFGMYWKKDYGHYWYQSEIESQAMLIECFEEITNDRAAIDEMKIFLLKQKQTKRWSTGKATVEACYALLIRGTDMLTQGNNLKVEVGKETFEINNESANSTAGTGYYKTSWDDSKILPEMSKVTAENEGKSVAWGAVYFQFYQQADLIKESKNTGLSVTKDLYVKRYSAEGEILNRIDKNTILATGEIVVVKLTINSDRDFDFVHLKDMRAAGLESFNDLSGYRYSGGLGFYSSIQDVARNFYINRLNRGSYVLEYELKVNNGGSFSSGIATIQSFYAPEFSGHSKGSRLEILK